MTTGHPYPRAMNQADISTREDHPHVGASVAATSGKTCPAPPFVLVPDFLVVNGQFRSGQNAGFLGTRYDPIVPGGDPSRADFRPADLGFGHSIDADRLRSRRALLDRSQWRHNVRVDRRSPERRAAFRDGLVPRKSLRHVGNRTRAARVRSASRVGRDARALRIEFLWPIGADGPPLARSRGPAGARQLHVVDLWRRQELGHAQGQFQPAEPGAAAADRPGDRGPVGRFVGQRPAGRDAGGGHRRIRPHTQDQSGRRTRSLAARVFGIAGRSGPVRRTHVWQLRQARGGADRPAHHVVGTGRHDLSCTGSRPGSAAHDTSRPPMAESARPTRWSSCGPERPCRCPRLRFSRCTGAGGQWR